MDARPKVYIAIPAQVTGDLWHLAAALVLAKKYGTNKADGLPGDKGLNCHLIVALAISLGPNIIPAKGSPALGSWNNEKDLMAKQELNGRATFNFLRNLGLDVMLVGIQNWTDDSLTCNLPSSSINMPKFLLGTPAATYDGIYTKYKELVTPMGDFDKVWADLKLLKPDHAASLFLKTTVRITIETPYPASQERVAHYMAATTVAMQALQDPATRPERQIFLRDSLGAYAPEVLAEIKKKSWTEVQVETLARAKFDALKGRCKDAIAAEKIIVLYNNRGNNINRQTSSTKKIYDDFKVKFELARGAASGSVVYVPINTDGDAAIPDQFDLFNKTEIPPPDYPGLDPLVTCHFYALVAKATHDNGKKIFFGIFSGRSGSVDVAAFNGVNTYFWDEPWLEVARKNEAALKSWGYPPGSLADPPVWSTFEPQAQGVSLKNGNDQIPQCLRCLQMAVICHIGSPVNTENANTDWGMMRDKPFNDWATGKTPAGLSDCVEVPNPAYSAKSADNYTKANWLYWKATVS
jgi:hypothetical protein